MAVYLLPLGTEARKMKQNEIDTCPLINKLPLNWCDEQGHPKSNVSQYDLVQLFVTGSSRNSNSSLHARQFYLITGTPDRNKQVHTKRNVRMI